MKSFILVFTTLCLLNPMTCDAQSMQKEVETTIKALINCSIDKDVDKAMSFWNKSQDIVYIADGVEYNTKQLRELYLDFFQNLEKMEIIEHSVSVKPLGKYKACCIWRGSERYKITDQEPVVSKWISTFIMENKKGGWVILHGHSSHL